MLWYVTLAMWMYGIFASGAIVYDVRMCCIYLFCISLFMKRCVALLPSLPKAPDWSNKKLNGQ